MGFNKDYPKMNDHFRISAFVENAVSIMKRMTDFDMFSIAGQFITHVLEGNTDDFEWFVNKFWEITNKSFAIGQDFRTITDSADVMTTIDNYFKYLGEYTDWQTYQLSEVDLDWFIGEFYRLVIIKINQIFGEYGIELKENEHYTMYVDGKNSYLSLVNGFANKFPDVNPVWLNQVATIIEYMGRQGQ